MKTYQNDQHIKNVHPFHFTWIIQSIDSKGAPELMIIPASSWLILAM